MNVPDARDWSPSLCAWLCTGREAIEAVSRMPSGAVVAVDSETPSVTDSFTIKCVTAAWTGEDGRTVSVLLDPLRRTDDLKAAAEICYRAGELVLHNSAFDIPGMVHAGVMAMSDLAKVTDTIIYARAAWNDTFIPKTLEALCAKLLGTPVVKGGLQQAWKAAGFRSRDEWFAKADIDMPFYRTNAMADTIFPLRLLAPVRAAAVDRQLNHPFGLRGATDRNEALAIVDKAQRVNRITLRRGAVGLERDLDYLDTYRDSVDADMMRASAVLRDAGLRPGNGDDLVKRMDEIGLIPPEWPRTEKTNKLSATKENVKLLDHPLATAHRVVDHGEKIIGYLEKTVARSAFTGRVHPQIKILGASATGRMSVSEPELQQFPAEARPIILEDAPGRGITSVDWSSIEPAILAWAANDVGFIAPFEQGADLYEPIQLACDVVRDTAKTVLLAQLYGQSLWKMALRIKKSNDEAKAIKANMFAAMPECERFMDKLKAIAEQYKMIPTLGGRVLTISMIYDKETGKKKVASYKAVNSFCQGSNADLVYEVFLIAERDGWADQILLAMHDELLVDTAVAEELERAMQTPPEYFQRWTSRWPTIRTDRHDLQRSWAKC